MLRNVTWAHRVWFCVSANCTTPGDVIQIIIQIVQCAACATGHINPVPTENDGDRGRLSSKEL